MTKPKLEPVRLHLGIIGDEVCRWYDKGLLSQSKCSELLEITRSEFLKQIHERGIAAIQTTFEELQTEVDAVLPTHPTELSGNTGELKQTKEAQSDSELLDWAEANPEKAMDSIQSWWATCGRGGRELGFNFRHAISEAMSCAAAVSKQ